MSLSSDLQVLQKGAHLSNLQIDFVVSGGIACIESPRIIRELRRYGANVRAFMTDGALKFIAPLPLEWASAQPVVRELSSSAEHISTADAVVISPCTLDFLAKISLGLADSAAATLVQSVIGRKPVFIQTSMHESLAGSPSYQEHREKLSKIPKVFFLEPKQEEEKLKSTDPETLVAEISHILNRKSEGVLLLMGPTLSPLDDVRFLSNRSSGRLGLKIADEVYRSGFDLNLISGPVAIEFPRYLKPHFVETREQMRLAALDILREKKIQTLIQAAAILDFEVATPSTGKKSSAEVSWTVALERAPKLIDELKSLVKNVIAFKLESGMDEGSFYSRVAEWAKKSGFQYVLANRLEEVSAKHHSATFFDFKNQSSKTLASRDAIAREIVSHI